jgi:hypothetical protein
MQRRGLSEVLTTHLYLAQRLAMSTATLIQPFDTIPSLFHSLLIFARCFSEDPSSFLAFQLLFGLASVFQNKVLWSTPSLTANY